MAYTTLSDETWGKLNQMQNVNLTSIEAVIDDLISRAEDTDKSIELEMKLKRYEEFERDIRTTLKGVLSRGPLAVDFVEDTGEEMDSYE
jgi:hypothetical protein